MEYKRRILAEFEAAASPAERGALLRRENLYHSHLLEWGQARDARQLEAGGPGEAEPTGPVGAGPRRRGAKQGASQQERELDKLRRDYERQGRELTKTKLALEIMGKASALLEQILSESAEPRSTTSIR